MTTLNRNDKHLDLVCDFPARETFRTSLLNRLMAIAADENATVQPEQSSPKVIRLDDDDLGMLAAAEGEARPPE